MWFLKSRCMCNRAMLWWQCFYLFSVLPVSRRATDQRDRIKCELRHDIWRIGRASLYQNIVRNKTKNIARAHNKCFDLAFTCKLYNRKRKIKLVKMHYFMECTDCPIQHRPAMAPPQHPCCCTVAMWVHAVTAVEQRTNEIFILNWICRSRRGLGTQYSMNVFCFSLLFLCFIHQVTSVFLAFSSVLMLKSIQKLWPKHKIVFIR